jgi:hypothetical protein
MDGASTSKGPPRTYLMFNGIDDRVEGSSSPLFSVATTGALTVSVWMMPQVLTFSHSVKGYVHWLGKGTGFGNSGQQEWTFRMYNLVNDANRPNRISFYVFNPEGRLGVGSYFEDPDDPVVAGRWMHFTGVADNVQSRSTRTASTRGTAFSTRATVPAGSSLMPPAIGSSSIRWPVLRRYASAPRTVRAIFRVVSRH